MNIVEKIKSYLENRKLISENKKILKKYPFLKIKDPKTGETNYTTTWLDFVPSGWTTLALKYFDQIKEILEQHNAADYLVLMDVKEKWGMLRIYYSFCNCPNPEQNKWVKDIEKLFKELEKESWKYCISCGTKAKYMTDGWITPICEDCKNEMAAQYPNVDFKNWEK